jgi:8-oxo-dGTP pyrophosphatase MutT (NUDIX family)
VVVPTREFVHVFIERDGVGLFLQHRDNIPGIFAPNKLGVFGGHIDPEDVSPEAAGIRELREETGIVVANLLPLGVIESDGIDPRRDRIHKIVHAFLTIVEPQLCIPVFEGQGGKTLFFGQPIPRDPQPTGTLVRELGMYFSNEFPNIGDFYEATA